MEQILDFSVELNIATFDKVVATFFRTAGPEQLVAKQLLEQFQEHPNSWERVDQILEHSSLIESRFIALQILEKLIKTMWKVLPPQNRQGIKNFIIAFIIKTASDEVSLERNRTLLSKLNIILKQDWPHNWPTFIPEIVVSSKSNLSLCENNMMILKLLRYYKSYSSEEIFDYSLEQMTQSKTKQLKSSLCDQFSEIFQLCHEILSEAEKPSLISATLHTLLRFLNWIPLGYIFETDLINLLCNRFFSVPAFRNVVLKCLTEIGSLQVGPEYNDKFVLLYKIVMEKIVGILPITTNIPEVYENSTDDDQNFVQNMALFFSSFLGSHLKPLEAAANADPATKEVLLLGHKYLIRISEVKDREVFKICLEYWTKLVAELYDDFSSAPRMANPLLNLSSPVAFGGRQPNYEARVHLYAEIMSMLRVVMIEAMVRPEEVLIVENDEGEIVRETLKESDTIILYKSMREVLVYLTHLDTEDTEQIMSRKLEKQMDGSEWSWDNLNKLCWAVGSISGALSEDTEKRFLVMVIKDLLSLCEMKRGKDNKAVVASNIMYVVGQYPRFLKAHWKFLKTVVNKLFEFMHELHEGVQDMACDTFIKISQKCRRHFVIQQPSEVMPYIEEILQTIDSITSDLQPQQVHTFYEAVGYMISAQPNKAFQERLIVKYMELPNRAWDNLIQQAGQNVNVLNSPENVKILANILKTNVSACTAVGSPFICQIGRIFMDLLGLYKAVGGLISEAIVEGGPIATKTPRVRGLRTIKKEILKLVDTYIQKAEDLNAVNQNMIPALLEAVLVDYSRNVEPAKEPEVLNVMANIVTKLGSLMSDKVPGILDAVFECTLNMINKNFEEYPEHRIGFFKLLQAINLSCFDGNSDLNVALLTLGKPQFRMFMDSIVWSFKHTMRDIGEVGLCICVDLIANFQKCDRNLSNQFFQDYYISLLQDIFFVLTSTSHKAVESNQITVPLYDTSVIPPNTTNSEYISKFVSDMLLSAFPHLQAIQVQQFTIGLFKFANDANTFKGHLRDFLVTLKEFSGSDNAELYLEEREQALAEKQKADYEAALKIPGMLKPSQL
ncbi:Karyopherin transporter [Boothiomyces macroporosus]|uniref:Karyopherin transporter n=1 Tax=Boothiomyces macroporosus TaxID=261099 RepID=A0AAD5UJU6_9FUNG|nr:Karyopherin transporter [Boothiomyces macroporosus]